MKSKVLVVLTAVALLSAAAGGIGTAYAYFTTNAEAAGRQTVSLGDQTTIEERYSSWKKTVSITNDEASDQAVYVRARAFSGAEYPLAVVGTDWRQEGEWYVYGNQSNPGIPVAPGLKTTDLEVSIGGLPEDKEAEARAFNVVIVYETTPAVQNGYENGQIQYEAYDASVWDRGLTAEGGENS